MKRGDSSPLADSAVIGARSEQAGLKAQRELEKAGKFFRDRKEIPW